jgi:hypothetical protein
VVWQKAKKTAGKSSKVKTLLTTKHWQTSNIARLVKTQVVQTTGLEVGDVVVLFENDDVWQVAEIIQKGSAYEVHDAGHNVVCVQPNTKFTILDRKCLVKNYKEPMFDGE